MSQILQAGQIVRGESSNVTFEVQQYLGGGGQGEVYRISGGETPMALKWYFPHYLQQDQQLRERLKTAINFGSPSDCFLWPIELTSAPRLTGFGYLMALREPRFKGLVDIMKRRIEPSFRSLATAGFELANSYLQLHAKGLCYRDISFDNVFFDPQNGEVRICDNDNVDINKRPGGILGTPRFMAPELVRGEAEPSIQTDLFSLAILLFYMLMIHHPLEGMKESQIHAFDAPAMRRLYGDEPVFIFDPENDSNRPVPEYHGNALAFWQIYPTFLRTLFTKAFTDGIKDPDHGRVRESQWRQAMIRLRDSIIYCGYCRSENFYDVHAMQMNSEKLSTCWQCRKELRLPPRIKINRNIVMLNHDTKLYAHHVNDQRLWDFSRPVAEMTQHPRNPNVWGLKNVSDEKWVIVLADGMIKEVEPQRSVTMAVGTKINFGASEGEIRF